MTSTMRPAAQPRVWDAVLTGLLMFVQVVLAVLAVSGLSFEIGATSCMYSLDCSVFRLRLGEWICVLGPWLIAGITIPGAIALFRRGTVAFWLPLLGAGLMCAAFAIGYTLASSA